MTASSQENDHFEHPVLADFYQKMSEVERIERELQEAKERLKGSVLDLAKHIGENTELRDQVISHLYWFHDKQVKASWISESFGLNNNTIARAVEHLSVEVICRLCKQPYDYIFTSRTVVKRDMPDIKRGRYPICSNCQSQQNADYEQKRLHQREQEYQQRQRIYQLQTMPYREYLKTPEWQKTRMIHLKRAKFSCQVCNAYGIQLDVHHRTYKRRGYEIGSDLVVLCHNCHEIFHTNGKLAHQ